MGGAQSNEQEQPETIDPVEMTEDMKAALDQNTYYPGNNAKYPYFLIQLNEQGELPFGDNDIFISDCIAAYVAANPITHIIVQTHGWNTPPDKAVAVPFTEFMGGMQNDAAMPTDNFNPIFVAFIWPAVPYDFLKEEDAMTRTELLINHEKQNSNGQDTDISLAAEAAKAAIESEDMEENEQLSNQMKVLAEHTSTADEDDDEDEDEDFETKVQRAKETPLSGFVEGVLSTFTPVLRPLQNLAFGRLMKRGRKCGTMMGACIAKFMYSAQNGPLQQRPKVTMMANSLGAHMLVGALNKSDDMPYKIHAVFFVQGAIARSWFDAGRRYNEYAQKIAGPFVCTFSDKDFLLKNVFSPFHGEAIGFEGFAEGDAMDMKALDELEDSPYEFGCGKFCSINSSNFIDEGNSFAGGHGDFKEDETTSLYWSMIKTELDDSAYDK